MNRLERLERAGRLSRSGAVAAALLLLFAAARRAMADSAEAGTAGGTFLQIGAGSARAVSMGQSIAADVTGTDALLWNPAGIAESSEREFSLGDDEWVQGITAQTIGYVQPLGRTVVGVGATYLDISGFDTRDDNGIPISNAGVYVRDMAAYASIAHSFLYEKLFLGATLKEVYQDNAGPTTDTVCEDFGAILKPWDGISFGASLMNYSNNSSAVASTQRLGAAWKPADFFNLTGELSKQSDNQSRAGVGVEFIVPEEVLRVGSLAFRAGYFTVDGQGQSENSLLQSLNLDYASGLSFGLGLYSTQLSGYGVSMDYAFLPVGALGTSNQFVLKVQF